VLAKKGVQHRARTLAEDEDGSVVPHTAGCSTLFSSRLFQVLRDVPLLSNTKDEDHKPLWPLSWRDFAGIGVAIVGLFIAAGGGLGGGGILVPVFILLLGASCSVPPQRSPLLSKDVVRLSSCWSACCSLRRCFVDWEKRLVCFARLAVTTWSTVHKVRACLTRTQRLPGCAAFPTNIAVALSNITIVGGSISNFVINVGKRHHFMDRPLIDWELILVMEPATILGALVGGYMNRASALRSSSYAWAIIWRPACVYLTPHNDVTCLM
jgi:hypothetical protein